MKKFDSGCELTTLSIILNCLSSLVPNQRTLIEQVAKVNFPDYMTKYVIGLWLNSTLSYSLASLRARVYFQGESLHAAPVSVNALTNGLLGMLTERSRHNSVSSTQSCVLTHPRTLSIAHVE